VRESPRTLQVETWLTVDAWSGPGRSSTVFLPPWSFVEYRHAGDDVKYRCPQRDTICQMRSGLVYKRLAFQILRSICARFDDV